MKSILIFPAAFESNYNVKGTHGSAREIMDDLHDFKFLLGYRWLTSFLLLRVE